MFFVTDNWANVIKTIHATLVVDVYGAAAVPVPIRASVTQATSVHFVRTKHQ